MIVNFFWIIFISSFAWADSSIIPPQCYVQRTRQNPDPVSPLVIEKIDSSHSLVACGAGLLNAVSNLKVYSQGLWNLMLQSRKLTTQQQQLRK